MLCGPDCMASHVRTCANSYPPIAAQVLGGVNNTALDIRTHNVDHAFDKVDKVYR